MLFDIVTFALTVDAVDFDLLSGQLDFLLLGAALMGILRIDPTDRRLRCLISPGRPLLIRTRSRSAIRILPRAASIRLIIIGLIRAVVLGLPVPILSWLGLLILLGRILPRRLVLLIRVLCIPRLTRASILGISRAIVRIPAILTGICIHIINHSLDSGLLSAPTTSCPRTSIISNDYI